MTTTTISFPIVCWGKCFQSIQDLFAQAPYSSPIKPRSFERRLLARLDVIGELTEDFVERAFADREGQFEPGGAVYEILQLSTGLKYFGITSDPVHRKNSHFGCPPSSRSLITRAIRQHGAHDFRFRVLVAGDILRADLRRIERALILAEDTYWPNGFNARRGDLKPRRQ